MRKTGREPEEAGEGPSVRQRGRAQGGREGRKEVGRHVFDCSAVLGGSWTRCRGLLEPRPAARGRQSPRKEAGVSDPAALTH